MPPSQDLRNQLSSNSWLLKFKDRLFSFTVRTAASESDGFPLDGGLRRRLLRRQQPLVGLRQPRRNGVRGSLALHFGLFGLMRV